MNLFASLKPSPTADSIYYADLFIINGRVWLIMGAGKSEAAAIATDRRQDLDLGRDCFAIKREHGQLFARFDPGAIQEGSDLHRWHKLDIVAYCFDEQETEKRYARRSIALLEADHYIVGLLASKYHYPAYAAPHMFSGEVLERLQNPQRRCEKFLQVTAKVTGTTFVLVPYMPSVEAKAALYLAYEPGRMETFPPAA